MNQRKRNKRIRLRKVFSANIVQLMNKEFPQSLNKTLTLSKYAGISLSTVQRIIACETAITLDLIEILSETFSVEPHMLLLDNKLKTTSSVISIR